METRRVRRVWGGPRLGMTGSELVVRIDQSNPGPGLGIAVVAEDNGKRLWALDFRTTLQLLRRGSEMKGQYSFRSLCHI